MGIRPVIHDSEPTREPKLSPAWRILRLIPVVAVLGSPAALAADDDGFRQVAVTLDHPVDGPPISMTLSDGPGLLAVGRAGEDWRFSVISMATGEAVAGGEVPVFTFFYDAGDALGRGSDQVCFFDEHGLSAIDLQGSEQVTVIEVASIYHGHPLGGPTSFDLVRDLDGDGSDELLIPVFEGWEVVTRRDGGIARTTLAVPPRVRASERRISYEPREPRLGDADGDGLDDVVFLAGRQFVSFPQVSPGVFSSEARRDAIDAPLASEDQRVRWERDDGQIDQSDLEIEEVELVRDFDGDGVLDLLTDKSISEGVFDRRSEYHLYLGHREGPALTYPAEPDGSITSDGVQFDPLVVDIDGDGRLDMATPSTRLGLGRVVAALFSGKISVDLNVYRMRADGGYPEESDYRTKFKVEFDLTTGLTRYPAVAIADLDGDGAAELIVQEDEDELAIYPGVDDSSTFSEEARTLGVALPRNGQMLEARDLDDDGLSDLLIRYGPADGDGRSRELLILLSGKGE